MFSYCLNNPIRFNDPSGLCARAWAAGYQGPCPGQGMPGCMDKFPAIQAAILDKAKIDSSVPPDHPDYKPPKKWDGKKTKVKGSNQKGWPAKDGSIWIPKPGMDGGDGWVVVFPNGDHYHAYPGGKTRTHRKTEHSLASSLALIAVGVIGTAWFIGNDYFGYIADDSMALKSSSLVIIGLSGIRKNNICYICEEDYYEY